MIWDKFNGFPCWLDMAYVLITIYDDVGSEKNNQGVTWDTYFMGMAVLAAKRSDDPHTKVSIICRNAVLPARKIAGIKIIQKLNFHFLPRRSSLISFMTNFTLVSALQGRGIISKKNCKCHKVGNYVSIARLLRGGHHGLWMTLCWFEIFNLVGFV